MLFRQADDIRLEGNNQDGEAYSSTTAKTKQ